MGLDWPTVPLVGDHVHEELAWWGFIPDLYVRFHINQANGQLDGSQFHGSQTAQKILVIQ